MYQRRATATALQHVAGLYRGRKPPTRVREQPVLGQGDRRQDGVQVLPQPHHHRHARPHIGRAVPPQVQQLSRPRRQAGPRPARLPPPSSPPLPLLPTAPAPPTTHPSQRSDGSRRWKPWSEARWSSPNTSSSASKMLPTGPTPPHASSSCKSTQTWSAPSSSPPSSTPASLRSVFPCSTRRLPQPRPCHVSPAVT